MNEPAPLKEFDAQERDRIRRTLRRFMEVNRIGTPTLQSRIIQADTPHHRVIPLSTLQRFLANKHHTLDHHMDLCQAFAKALPYYAEGTEIPQLGAALLAFLNPPMNLKECEALCDSLDQEVAGSYDTESEPVGGGSPPDPRGSNRYTSEVTLTPAPGNAYLQAREIVPDAGNAGGTPERRALHDGVLIPRGEVFYIFLRNALTRQPKSYTLGKRYLDPATKAYFALEGQSFEAPEPTLPASSHCKVRFIQKRPSPEPPPLEAPKEETRQ